MKNLSTLLILFFFTLHLSANNEIWVGDVRQSWWTEQGVISDYYLTVQPAGSFAKCELTLVFDAELLSFTPSDSLELEMNFDLPKGAIVTDLWLWIFGQAEQADIHDRWTASLIYESIVQRRIDPAILTKNWDHSYNLKVFPIMTDMPRKVKIEYIVPVNFLSAQNYVVPLPLNIAQMSAQHPENVNIYFDGGETFTVSTIEEHPHLRFGQMSHPDDGPMMGISMVNYIDGKENVSLSYAKDYDSYMSVCYDNALDENFFEVNLKPSELFNLEDSKKTVFLIDFVDGYSIYNGEDLLLNLRSAILQHFDDNDSINLMFSGIRTAKACSGWIPCSDSLVNLIFDNISPEIFNSYSSIPPLLSDGVSFINSNGGDGNIVLISSGHDHGSREEANDLITDLMDLVGANLLPIHIINLDNYYYHDVDHYIGGAYYRGNEYLYKHLSLRTGAEFFTVTDDNLHLLLAEVASKLSGYFKNISIEIEFEDGYTYSVFDLYNTNTMRYYNNNVRMLGKYIGTRPKSIKGNAQKASGEVISNTLTLNNNNVIRGNKQLKQVWASYLLNELRTLPESNMVMSTIIETSIEYRVLCDYTAFLVLEPGFIPDIDLEDLPVEDELGWFMSTETVDITNQSALSNYPNPVSTQTTFAYSVNMNGLVELRLLGASGQLLEVLVHEEKSEGDYELLYSAEILPDGIYFYELRVNGKIVQQNKMIVVK